MFCSSTHHAARAVATKCFVVPQHAPATKLLQNIDNRRVHIVGLARHNMECDLITGYMKQLITDEKADTTEFEKGCGYVRFDSLAEYICLGRLVAEGFTEIDSECSEWLSETTGVMWVC